MASQTSVKQAQSLSSPASTPSAENHPSISFSKKNFLTDFFHYIRVDLSCNVTNPNHPHEVPQFVQASCIAYARESTRAFARLSPESVFWPGLLAFSDLEAKNSAAARQYRGCFLIGVRSAHRGGSQDPEKALQGLKAFEDSVRRHRIFVDEPKTPQLSVKLVTREQTSQLTEDRWMWPKPDAQALIVGADSMKVSQEYFIPTKTDSKDPMMEQKKLRPASDVLHRIRWDPEMKEEDYSVVYLDRFIGYLEMPVSYWRSDTSDDEFIPMHRITAFRKISTGEVVWSREARLDKIFGS